MLVALLAVPVIMYSLGNFDSQYTSAFAEGVTAFNSNPFTASWQDITSGLAWGLGYSISAYEGHRKSDGSMYVGWNHSGEWLPAYKGAVNIVYRW